MFQFRINRETVKFYMCCNAMHRGKGDLFYDVIYIPTLSHMMLRMPGVTAEIV
jgi:hypothetical protein